MKTPNQEIEKANKAIDLAIEKLLVIRGKEICGRDTPKGFLIHLSRRGITSKQIKDELEEYFKDESKTYRFEETDRDTRVGQIRPVDLVISGHFTSETLELFIVVDLKGEIKDRMYSNTHHVRFEAWCRLYYLPSADQWLVHYVDIIIRHKTPAERVLFMFRHDKSGNPIEAEEKEADALCLFFESLQGGTWG